MLLILDKKSIDILMESGNGKKDGEVKQWHNKELEEQVGQLMDIVIDYIRLLYMQIKWKNILIPRYVNYHWTVFCCKLNR